MQAYQSAQATSSSSKLPDPDPNRMDARQGEQPSPLAGAENSSIDFERDEDIQLAVSALDSLRGASKVLWDSRPPSHTPSKPPLQPRQASPDEGHAGPSFTSASTGSSSTGPSKYTSHPSSLPSASTSSLRLTTPTSNSTAPSTTPSSPSAVSARTDSINGLDLDLDLDVDGMRVVDDQELELEMAERLKRGLAQDEFEVDGEDGRFISRFSKTPFVSGALKAYSTGKNSNRMVRVGANLMEQSVRTIYGPVLDRAGRVVGPSNLNRVDEFACRQLDRLGKRYPGMNGVGYPSEAQAQSSEGIILQPDVPDSLDTMDTIDRDPTSEISKSSDRNTGSVKGKERATQPLEADQLHESDPALVASQNQQVVPRSRWQTLMLEAGMTAGGISAAVSEESMKSLKYCLHWLHYATAHLEHQITILRDFIASLNEPSSSAALVPQASAQKLNNVKRDIVDTIRRVVDVVSKYAGAALPDHARRFVRQSILSLPVKWASAVSDSRPMPKEDLPLVAENEAPDGDGAGPSSRPIRPAASTEEAASRILTFAVESMDMLRNVAVIFGESVDRAEAWVERLRVVGINHAAAQRHRRGQPDDPASGSTSTTSTSDYRLPSNHTSPGTTVGTKRSRSAHETNNAEQVSRKRRGIQHSTSPSLA